MHVNEVDENRRAETRVSTNLFLLNRSVWCFPWCGKPSKMLENVSVCVCICDASRVTGKEKKKTKTVERSNKGAQQEKFGAKLSGPTEHGGKWWWGLEDDKGSRERRRHSQREKRECETDQHSWSAGISTILGTTPISSLPWFFRLLAIRNLSSFPLSYCQLHILNSFTN